MNLYEMPEARELHMVSSTKDTLFGLIALMSMAEYNALRDLVSVGDSPREGEFGRSTENPELLVVLYQNQVYRMYCTGGASWEKYTKSKTVLGMWDTQPLKPRWHPAPFLEITLHEEATA